MTHHLVHEVRQAQNLFDLFAALQRMVNHNHHQVFNGDEPTRWSDLLDFSDLVRFAL